MKKTSNLLGGYLFNIASLAMLLWVMPSSYAEDAVGDSAEGWELFESIDELDGSVTKAGILYSENLLKGWLDDALVAMYFICEDETFMFSSEAKFEPRKRAGRRQDLRIKVDDNEVIDISLPISDSFNSMYLISAEPRYDRVRNELIAGVTMKIELELFNEGTEQIANFNVAGLNDVIKWCDE